MSHHEQVRALRQQLRDAGVVLDGNPNNGGLSRTTEALGNVSFVSTGASGDIRILMSCNGKLLKAAIRPGSLRRHERVALGRMIRETIQESETVLRDTFSSMKGSRS